MFELVDLWTVGADAGTYSQFLNLLLDNAKAASSTRMAVEDQEDPAGAGLHPQSVQSIHLGHGGCVLIQPGPPPRHPPATATSAHATMGVAPPKSTRIPPPTAPVPALDLKKKKEKKAKKPATAKKTHKNKTQNGTQTEFPELGDESEREEEEAPVSPEQVHKQRYRAAMMKSLHTMR